MYIHMYTIEYTGCKKQGSTLWTKMQVIYFNSTDVIGDLYTHVLMLVFVVCHNFVPVQQWVVFLYITVQVIMSSYTQYKREPPEWDIGSTWGT